MFGGRGEGRETELLILRMMTKYCLLTKLVSGIICSWTIVEYVIMTILGHLIILGLRERIIYMNAMCHCYGIEMHVSQSCDRVWCNSPMS